VSAARREQIGKVQAARLHFHQKLLGCGVRVGNLLQFENFGTAETSDDERVHGESLSVLSRNGWGRPALHDRDRVDPRSPVSASIMMIEFPISSTWGNSDRVPTESINRRVHRGARR